MRLFFINKEISKIDKGQIGWDTLVIVIIVANSLLAYCHYSKFVFTYFQLIGNISIQRG